MVSIKILIFLAVMLRQRETKLIQCVDDNVLLSSCAQVYATPRTHHTRQPRPLYTVEQTLAIVSMFATYCPHGKMRGKCKRCKKPGAQP